jgi:AraC family transcriptional regulator
MRLLASQPFQRHAAEAAAASPAGPIVHALAAGSGWSMREFVCTAGPGDRAFEERHEAASIALVVEGSFTYRAGGERHLLHPGALLLGNPGVCYSCGHDHGAGDRCLSLRLEPESLAEIAAGVGAPAEFRFPAAMLPARNVLPPHRALLAAGRHRDELLADQEIMALVGNLVRHFTGATPRRLRVSAQDERRIARALRHAEKAADRPLDLDQLAGEAAMSRYHFLRVFRRVVGETPYQYVIGLRLARAAERLLVSRDPVSRIAFEQGFGDLSTFNARFRARFGQSPTAFRASATRFAG